MRKRIFKLAIAASAAAIVLLSALSCSNPSSPAPNPVSTDARLSSLTLSSGSTTVALDPAFTPSKTDYAASVPFSVTSLEAAVVPANSGATYQIEGNSGFGVGSSNLIRITVTAADKATKKIYKVTVNRGSGSSEAVLDSLSVSGYEIDPAFSPLTTSYSLNVANSVTQVTVNAEAGSGGTLVSGGTVVKTLVPGTNTIAIVVNSQDGSASKQYNLSVSRAAAPPALSSNAYLSSLSIATPGATITPEFSSSVFDYYAQIPNEADTFTIAATAMDANAEVAGDDVALTSPAIGFSGDFTVTVTAEDGITTKEYGLTVYRKNASLSSDSSLASLALYDADDEPIAFTPAFSSITTSYSATVPYSVSFVYPDWSAAGGSSIVESDGILEVGSNEYSLAVTAEDGVSKTTYTITITREGPAVSGLTVSTPGPGAVLSGDDIAMSGSITGTAASIACMLIGPDCPAISIDVGGSSSSRSWSASLLDTTATTNGPKVLIVTPLDADGRQAGPLVTVPVIVDNASASYGSTLSGTCTFSGGARASGFLFITAYRIGSAPSDVIPEATIVRALDASSDATQDFTLTGLLTGDYIVSATYFATAADLGIAPALLGESNQVTISGAAAAGADIVL